MADSKGGDVEMRDAAADSTPSASPFALLNPKLELHASPPRASQPVKPKFEPKVKPRPGARARPQQPAQSEPEVAPKAGRSALPVPESASVATSASSSGEDGNSNSSGSNPLVTPQIETKSVKEEVLNGETLDEGALFRVKEEPGSKAQGDALQIVEDLKLELDVKEELLNGPGLPKAEEDLPNSQDEVPVVKDEHLDANGPSLDRIDRVVREIDVFVTPKVDAETQEVSVGWAQLYLLQYPLRPSWRPYGLEDRCQEVRIKPQQSKLEVDLAVDTKHENYDEDRERHLKISKQTLTSSKAPMNTSYAIGVLRGNQLHLNPIQAVVQLRHSMKYIDDHDAMKKKSNKEAGITDGEDEEIVEAESSEAKSEMTPVQVSIRRRETERQEATRLQSHAYLKQLDEAEAWIPLDPLGTDSPVTEGIREKMVASTSNIISFDMSPELYIDTLVPGRANTSTVETLREDGSGNAEISRSFLDTLSLDERFDVLLSKGHVQVLQFERLMKLAPSGCTEAEVLRVLKDKAVLVQGCWVASSCLRYVYPMTVMRDFILYLFHKNRVVLHEQLEELNASKEVLREIMLSIAVQRGAVGWEFQESTDRSFIKKHQAVVKDQANQWAGSEPGIQKQLSQLNPSHVDTEGAEPMDLVEQETRPTSKDQRKLKEKQKNAPASSGGGLYSGKPKEIKALVVGDGGQGSKKNGIEAADISDQVTMSLATESALPGALREIFLKHHVCSLQIICQSLRDIAIERTAANSNPKAVAAAVAAAKGANAPLPELAAAVSKVATNIDNVYFLSSLGNPALDPFREVVIKLLRVKGPISGLRKSDIMEAAKIALKSEVPTVTYQKVLKELCYTRGGAWVLKPGDGRPQ